MSWTGKCTLSEHITDENSSCWHMSERKEVSYESVFNSLLLFFTMHKFACDKKDSFLKLREEFALSSICKWTIPKFSLAKSIT